MFRYLSLSPKREHRHPCLCGSRASLPAIEVPYLGSLEGYHPHSLEGYVPFKSATTHTSRRKPPTAKMKFQISRPTPDKSGDQTRGEN
jgi:hypothetical protein